MAILIAVLVLGMPPAARGCTKRAPTLAASLGPHDFSSPPENNVLWREGDPGEPLFLHARVLDTCGEPIEGARIQVLHANHDGEHEPDRWRAVLHSDERGEFRLTTVLPGYAGSLPRHIHVIITRDGYRRLITRLFFKNDPEVDESIEDLTVVVDEVRRGDARGWTGGYEFVLPPG